MSRFLAALCVGVLLLTAAAHADDSGFLPAQHLAAAAKSLAPLRNAPHFFPLAPRRNFFALPRRPGFSTTAPALQEHHQAVADVASTPASGMTREQAHQILSLFSSAR